MREPWGAGHETKPSLSQTVSSARFLFRVGSWAKLQGVLAAQQFECNSDVLGLFVGLAWKAGKAQSIMTGDFGPEQSTSLFKCSSAAGLNALEPSPKAPIKTVLYRGGTMDPTLSYGMAWTEKKDVAAFFATRMNENVPVVLSTRTADNQVLARFKHESEVVLPYEPSRPFEIEFL